MAEQEKKNTDRKDRDEEAERCNRHDMELERLVKVTNENEKKNTQT